MTIANGVKTWRALKKAFHSATRSATEDEDVWIEVFGGRFRQVTFIKPDAFLFSESEQPGPEIRIVCHYTQLVAQIIVLPRSGNKRRVTGFSTES